MPPGEDLSVQNPEVEAGPLSDTEPLVPKERDENVLPDEDLPGQDQEVEAGPVSGTGLLVPKGVG